MKKLSKILVCTFMFLMIGFVMAGCNNKVEIKPFSISGKVICDDKPLIGAKISSELGEVLTDENGMFIFSELKAGLTISVDKAGYIFPLNTFTIFSASDNVDFVGYKKFNVNGKVVSNNLPISDVKISAVGIKTAFTYTNESGEFMLTNLAGSTKIKAELNGYVFEEKTALNGLEEVIFNGTTNIAGSVQFENFVSQDEKNQTKISVDGEILDLKNDGFSLSNIALGTLIEPINANFVFEPQNIILQKENQKLNFKAYKKFDVTGTAKSGDKKLSDVKIFSGDKQVATTNSNGEFVIFGLHAQVVLSAVLSGYEFENINTSILNKSIEIIGKTSISGKVVFENSNLSDVLVQIGDRSVVSDIDGNFSLHNLLIGDELIFTKDGYHIDNHVVNASNEIIEIYAQKIYNLNLTVFFDGSPLSDVNVIIDKISYKTDSEGLLVLNGLYGEKDIVLSKEGYSFESLTISYKNCEISILAEKFYDLNINVKSGELILANAKIIIESQTFELNEMGSIQINNLLKTTAFKVVCDGYNDANFSASYNNNNFNVNLCYNISGTIKSGNVRVSDVRIICDENVVFSDKSGNFNIHNLSGESHLVFEKNGYIFEVENIIVNCAKNDISVNCTYTISGIAVSGDSKCNDLKIYLTRLEDNQQFTTTTDSEGFYIFNGVCGENVVFSEKSADLNLRPNYYTVTEAGTYDFSANGYELGGYIFSGDLPVSNVKVTAGDISVFTDENGKYYFNLLTKNLELVAFKEGYTFNVNNLEVTSSDNFRTDLNFNCSYEIFGRVRSGYTPVPLVDISFNDRMVKTDTAGNYKITGLVGKNNLYLEKTGYAFEGITEVSKYGECNFSATFTVSGNVKNGDNFLKDVLVSTNDNNILTDESGYFILSGITAGENLRFEKKGYIFTGNFSQLEFAEGLEFNSTYSVIGKVLNLGIGFSNVIVSLNGKTVYTDSEGSFAFDELTGTNELLINKTNYKFQNVTVNGYSELIITPSYDINGIITLGSIPLSGVSVEIGNITVLSDENGRFEFVDLSGQNNIKFVKNGYDFTGPQAVNGPVNLEIYASYIIRGRVNTGSFAIKDVNVEIGGNRVITDSDGSFELRSLVGEQIITFSKEGYNSVTLSVNDYNSNLIINMSFNITVIINGVSDLSGFKAICNNNEWSSDSSGSIVINNLEGNVIINITKIGFIVSPSSFETHEPISVNVTANEVYSINGCITADGFGVSGLTVKAGNKTTVTDSNGNYRIEELTGKIMFSSYMEYDNKTVEFVKNVQISEKGEYSYTINSSELSYAMFERAYYLITKSTGFYSTLKGAVKLSMGGTQSVTGFKKIDASGNFLFQRTNYGDEILGINPKLSLLTYFNKNTLDTRFIHTKDCKQDGSPVYNGAAWTLSDRESYKSKYGGYPDGMYIYLLNQSTILSTQNFKKENGFYSFSFNLSPTTSTAGYTTQIQALSGEKPSKFNSIKITFTINESGYISKIQMIEEYEIVKIVTVKANADITEIYVTDNGTSVVPEIDYNRYEDFIGPLNFEKISELKIVPIVLERRREGNEI